MRPCLSVVSSSQDSVQPVIIKEEGLDAFTGRTSPDAAHCVEEAGPNEDHDPDYQVDIMDTMVLCNFSICKVLILFTVCLCRYVKILTYIDSFSFIITSDCFNDQNVLMKMVSLR